MTSKHEKQILTAWNANAGPWIRAVEQAAIRAPGTLTTSAVLRVIEDYSPAGGSILDAGCGEGWLVRELTRLGYRSTGIDAVPELIDHARRQGSETFRVLDYEQLQTTGLGRFDLVVNNFALLGNTSTCAFLKALPELLNPSGVCVIQTLHPVAFFHEGEYSDGWKPGTWAGLPGDFGEPAPWYFRTLSGWLNLFTKTGLTLREIREPYTGGQPPQSIIFVVQNTR
ncbi:class I SAM-dependent methyltransferase [Marinobacter sp.]|uniref:class I SAM-dependent methyltransferase n=1 Tax=Marinobacter sp. TaxID=50741 RepID=UPI0035628D5E